ncbi:MAG: hypothetical protein LBE11_07760 [Prevotellaceae bacterium]|jgi:hypothetical protein|nr:hypothetical protein [Prevotellaceae bacterium]
MKQKIKIYRMSIARVFPATHPRAGGLTHFAQAIIQAKKIHTVRAIKPNSKTWNDKIHEVLDGKAVLVVYQWNGKPYSSDGCTNQFVFGTNQTQGFINELLKSDKYRYAIPVIDSGIGVQKALFIDELGCISVVNTEHAEVNINEYYYSTIARNDGLSLEDFKAWFADNDFSKPFEIIHFTEFRY